MVNANYMELDKITFIGWVVKTLTRKNIMSWFKVTWILPLNLEVVTEKKTNLNNLYTLINVNKEKGMNTFQMRRMELCNGENIL
jgi:hypothetical protein